MKIEKEKIVSFLKAHRKQKKLSQGDVAQKAGFFQQQISKLENMTIEFTLEDLNAWCLALDLSPMQVLLHTHPMQPLTEDLSASEERKKREVDKTEILAKTKEISDKVRDVLDYIKKM